MVRLSHSERQPCAQPLDRRLVFELMKVGVIIVPITDKDTRLPKVGQPPRGRGGAGTQSSGS